MVITMASYALQRHLGWRTQSRLGQSLQISFRKGSSEIMEEKLAIDCYFLVVSYFRTAVSTVQLDPLINIFISDIEMVSNSSIGKALVVLSSLCASWYAFHVRYCIQEVPFSFHLKASYLTLYQALN